MFINPIADYRIINPASIGTITIVRPPSPTDGYSIPSAPTLVLSGECAGLKLEERQQGSERAQPGLVDRTLWNCLVADTEENRAIEPGMWCRIVRSTGVVLVGKVDLVEPKLYAGIRIYVDTAEAGAIDWEAIEVG